MALDEALLLHACDTPVLRLYTWKPDTLSLGYFQRWKEVPQTARASAVVRRTTGGGAIHHAEELTFSIAAPLAHPLYRGEVQASYVRVHEALAEAFAGIGVRSSLRGEQRLESDDSESAMCFHRSTSIDLTWHGAKGVGSAQRRSGGRVLHHGSVKLGTTPLEGSIATLHAIAGDLSVEDLSEYILAAFAERFAARFERGEPTAREARHAQERAGFFTSREHLQRR